MLLTDSCVVREYQSVCHLELSDKGVSRSTSSSNILWARVFSASPQNEESRTPRRASALLVVAFSDWKRIRRREQRVGKAEKPRPAFFFYNLISSPYKFPKIPSQFVFSMQNLPLTTSRT